MTRSDLPARLRNASAAEIGLLLAQAADYIEALEALEVAKLPRWAQEALAPSCDTEQN
jgi:hypothetical protein